MLRLEGLGKLKNNIPHPGLEPATFQLIAECLNQLRSRVPQYNDNKNNYSEIDLSRNIFGIGHVHIQVFA
jgi:hypothetical protein